MTDKEKKLALDHLFYEIWMLNETHKKLILNRNLLEFNILIESFLIHVRNIVCFLENKKYDNDIKCSDFGVKGIVVNLLLRNGLNEINKSLGHLTWDRIKKDKPNWNSKITSEIKTLINTGIRKFIEQLPPELFPTSEYRKNKQDFFFN